VLRLALIVLTGALALGGSDALAQDKKDKKEAIKDAKEAAKEKAKEAAKDKAKDKGKDKDKGDKDDKGEHGKAAEDHGKGKDGEHGKDGEDHGKPADGDKAEKKVDAEGRGKAMTVDEENAKHAKRLEKIGALEAKAKDKPELTAKVTMLREKETRRHEKALARINGGGGDKKDEGKKDEAKKEGAK
jgi:hypothetical protein